MKTTAPLAPVDLAAALHAHAPGRPTKLYLILALLLAALGVGGWFWWLSVVQARSLVPAFATEVLTRGAISLTITATGNLEPTKEVTVGSELSGTTLEVYVDINDHVTKGQPLAKLDTSKLTQQTESSRAAVKSARARVTLAEATVQESSATLFRQEELSQLSGGRIPAKSDLDTAVATAARARADALSAQAAVGEAEAQVRINENDLAKALIKSPIDGIVLTRSIEPGQTVAASFTAPELFVIAENLAHMKLKVAIAEADIGRVAQGQKSFFSVDAWPDRAYNATVSRVAFGSVVTNNVVTYLAELEVANDDLSLRPGMTATSDISVAESKDVFLVPTTALRFSPATASTASAAAKKSFVQSLIPMPTRNSNRPVASDSDTKSTGAHLWILRNGQPEALLVTIGLSDGRHTEVSGDGLSAGLVVITRALISAP